MTAHAIGTPTESRLVPVAVAAGVLTAAAAGWVVLARRMAGMDMSPGGDPGTLGWFAITWVVMTAAMMLPGSAPAVARAVRGRGGAVASTAAAYVTAYGAVWLAAGLAGYGCVQAVRALDVAALGWASAGRYVAAATVVAAGLYQLTGVKRRWLTRCVDPGRHLPRPGISGALRAGAGHGACCVACCATLMVALYALGSMSLTWMVLVTVLIAGERLAAESAHAVSATASMATVFAVGTVLAVLGIGIAVAPASVPGLTTPPAAGHLGMGMGMGSDTGMGTGPQKMSP